VTGFATTPRSSTGSRQRASHDFGWRRNGLIALYTTERGLADGIAGAAALGRLEIPSQQLDAPAVARLEPRITGSVLGGILYPEDAHLDPGEFVTAVAGLARAHGARIDEGAPVVRLRGNGRIEAVETTAETIRPQVVVLANGAWAPALARGVRLPLLVEAGKGFSLTYPAAGSSFERPLRLGEVRTVVDDVRQRPRHEQARPGRAGHPRPRAARPLERVARVALRRAPDRCLGRAHVGALRPLTPDGLPLLGRSAAVGTSCSPPATATSGSALPR
jgi:D-amino-acid dehydrogenase